MRSEHAKVQQATRTRTWWAQTLMSVETMVSPRMSGIHAVDATDEADAVEQIRAKIGAPEHPAPAVLPRVLRDARAEGLDEDETVARIRTAVTNAMRAEPAGMIVTSIGTDFARVTGLGVPQDRDEGGVDDRAGARDGRDDGHETRTAA